MDIATRIIERIGARREADAKRFDDLDGDLCMLCHAYGADKRSLFMSCFYAIEEALPEAIDLSGVEDLKDRGYYLRICKSCRAAFLGHLQEWRNERIALREYAKDHDGHIYDFDGEAANIPVRVNGAIVMMTEEGYEAWKESQP